MKKILRLVTTSVLTLTLVACGGNSSSSQSTSTSTSTTSTYAAVSSITLSAAAETLEQVSTSLQKVTVSATLNSGVNPAQELEWYVNGTKSSQTGKSFEYTPTAVGEYAIVAKVGSVSSNTVTLKVSAPGLEIESVKVVSSKSLEIKGPEGASIAIEGKTIVDSSYYDLVNKKYIITLKEAVAQGNTLKITLSKDGASKTTSYTYDTRTVAVSGLTVDAVAAVKSADGSYTIIKPFSDAKETTKSYQISVATDDIVGASVQFKVETAVPATAAAINTTTSLEAMTDTKGLKSAAYSVSKDTIVGDYTHTITVGDKTTSVVIHVVDPSETVGVVAAGYEDDDDSTVAVEYYPVRYDGSGVAAEADGSFEIERPYETIADAYELDFKFFAKYFALNEYGINSTYTVTLTGPSTYGAAGGQLFDGIEMTSTGATKIGTKDNALTQWQYKDFDADSKTGFKEEIKQYITKDTPLGEYVFTISAGQSGAEKTASIKFNVVAPESKLSSKVSVVSEATGDPLTPLATGRQVAYTYDKDTNTYTFEKPLLSTSNYVYNFAFILDNGQSRVAELADTTADSLKTNTYDFQNDVFNLSTVAKTTTGYDPLAKVTIAVETWAAATAFTIGKKFLSDDGIYYRVKADISTSTFGSGTTLATAVADTTYFEKLADTADTNDKAAYAKYLAYVAENITIFGEQVGTAQLRVFSDYTYQVSSPSAGVKTTSGKYAIQLATDDTSIILANNGYSKSTADYGAYDASTTYAVGDLVTNSGLFYKCKTAITTGEGFTAAKWTQVYPAYDAATAGYITVGSNSVPGTYSYTLTLSDIGSASTLTSTLNIVIKDPTPQVFVLSSTATAAGVYVPATTDGTTVSAKSTTKTQCLQLGTTTKQAVCSSTGVYNIDITDVAASNDQNIYGLVAIADLAAGSYTYAVSKEYPNSSKNMASNGSVTIKAGAILSDGYIIDPASTNIVESNKGAIEFKDAWTINDTLSATVPGTYKYTFTIGSYTKEITINVGNYKSKLVGESITIAGVKLSKFGPYYAYSAADVTTAVAIDATLQLSASNIPADTELWISTAAGVAAGNTIAGNANLTKVVFDEDGVFTFKYEGFFDATDAALFKSDTNVKAFSKVINVWVRDEDDASIIAALEGVSTVTFNVNAINLKSDGAIS